jgi:sigma-E factor negative regulatory protein RseB
MRLPAFTWLWLAAGFVGGPASGQPVPVQTEGLQWLQRMTTAAQKVSYSGVFVYRNGVRSETSRIVHLASNGNQIEKLEVLDGSPREVIRHNDEVRCYLPDSRQVIVEQRSTRRGFPALLPVSLAGLSDHYQIRKGAIERVAGLESQIIRMEPRDVWRYGRQLWMDVGSGLLLKADIFNAQGESLESMAFTDLRIGEPVSAEAVKSRYASDAKGTWQLRQARLRDMRDDGPWQFRVELPGFRKQASMRRSMGHDPGDLSMLHWIFSDGLVAMSVFISPLRQSEDAGEEGLQTLGALSVMKRIVDGHQVVVMGDLPPAAVKHFAEGIGVRGK